MSKKVKKVTPELRFSEFKGDWIGKKLKEVSSISSGATPLRSNKLFFENATIPWVKTTDLNNAEIFQTEECISKIAIKETPARKNKIGSILVAMYGGFNQIGRTGLLQVEAATNQAISVVSPSIQVDSKYLLYFLNHNVGLWRRYAASSRKDPNITGKNVGDFPIAYPTIKEQKKIASFLNAIALRITQLRRKHELLKTYKKGVMQKIFSQQIHFKQDDGKPFPNWEKKKLGDIANIVMGQSPNSSSYNNQGIGKYLIQGNADILNRKTHPRQWTSEPTKLCNNGDLILTVRAPVGMVAKSNIHACIGRGVCSLNNKSNSNLEFLYQFLLNYEPSWIRLGQGSTFTAIGGADIRSLTILLPDFQEQEKIANFLTSIDKKIEAVALQIEKLEEFKKGLLQKMFV